VGVVVAVMFTLSSTSILKRNDVTVSVEPIGLASSRDRSQRNKARNQLKSEPVLRAYISSVCLIALSY
jgi:hypothetical protein